MNKETSEIYTCSDFKLISSAPSGSLQPYNIIFYCIAACFACSMSGKGMCAWTSVHVFTTHSGSYIYKAALNNALQNSLELWTKVFVFILEEIGSFADATYIVTAYYYHSHLEF